MRFIFITPRLDKNDELMAFLYYWIKELSKQYNESIVIALKGNKQDAKKVNAKVYLLNEIAREKKIFEIIKIIVKEKNHYDVIFVFMYPILMIFVGFIAKLFGKKAVMYYAHGYVGIWLRLATLLSNSVITTSKDGFRIKTWKKKVISQGINTEIFKPLNLKREKEILYIGRISKVKRIHMILKLLMKHKDWRLRIIGPIMDFDYYQKLHRFAAKQGLNVIFEGSLPNTSLPYYYSKARIFINPSLTGSMDKTVLEAWACELPVLTSNPAYFSILKEHNLDKKYFFEDQKDLEDKFENLVSKNFHFEKDVFREVVEKNSYKRFIKELVNLLNNI